MFATDCLALELSLLVAFLLRQGLSAVVPIHLQWELHYQPLALAVLVLPLGFWLIGLYPGYGMGMVERLRRRVCTILLMFVVLIAWDFMIRQGDSTDWSRGVMLLTLLLALVACPLSESVVRSLLVRCGCWGSPAVIFGANTTGEAVVRNLHEHRELGLVPVAILDDAADQWGERIDGVPVVGSVRQARQIASRHGSPSWPCPMCRRSASPGWRNGCRFAGSFSFPI